MPLAETDAFLWRFFDFGDWRLALTSPRRRRAPVRPAAEIARIFHPLPSDTGAEGLALFEDACSFAGGALMASRGVLVAESLAPTEQAARFGPLRRESDGAWTVRVWPMTRMQRLSGDFIFLRRSGDSEYAAWLVEMLPRVAIAAQFCDLSQFKIAVSLKSAAMERIVRDSLGLFGIGPGQIVALGEAPVFLQRVVYPLPIERRPFAPSPQAIEVLESLPARLAGTSEAPKRVYVASGTERLVNEAALLELLLPLGFVAVDPGPMSFADRIRAFSRADIIVGASGAGLANMAVAPRGVRVVELTPPGAKGAAVFRDLAEDKQGRFISLRGVAKESLGLKKGFSVDLAALGASLDEFLA